MTDFFISYTHVDRGWAEWIGYALEEWGFSVVIQAWDFRPGSNFVLEMQRATAESERTILVLSPDYLKSQFTSPEWAAAFVQDPQGLERKLVPVMVRPCEPKGLLAPITQIRIADKDEADARQLLSDGIKRTRVKPSSPPAFPGAVAGAVAPKAFPGADTSSSSTVHAAAYPLIPSLNRTPTDLEKRRFVKFGFETIRDLFESNLKQVQSQEVRIETDYQLQTASLFTAELFLDGKRKCNCKIWQGGLHSENGISYAEGSAVSGNGSNEILTLPQTGELRFQALMAMGSYQHEKKFSLNALTANDAAEYLWQRFVRPLNW